MDVDQKHRPTTRRSRSLFWVLHHPVLGLCCLDPLPWFVDEIYLIIPSFASFPSFNPPFCWPKPPLLMVNRGIEDFMNNFEQGVQAVKHEAGSGIRTPSRKLKAWRIERFYGVYGTYWDLFMWCVCVCVVFLGVSCRGVHQLYSVSPLFYICLCRFPLQTLYLSLIMSFMMSRSIQFPFPKRGWKSATTLLGCWRGRPSCCTQGFCEGTEMKLRHGLDID